jgi:hypothetical protein
MLPTRRALTVTVNALAAFLGDLPAAVVVEYAIIAACSWRRELSLR